MDPTFTSMVIALALTLVSISAPPLLDGIERKVKATIHSRVGPPVLQTWFDILKLLSKEIKLPKGAELVGLAVFIGVSIAIVLTVLLSIFVTIGLTGINAVVMVMILLFSLHSLSMTVGCISMNPFATIGSFRKVFLNIVNEVGLALSIALALISRQYLPSPKGLALLVLATAMLIVASFSSSGRLPYDIHEAEPELASGAIIELSGPLLAAELYSLTLERWVLASLPIYVSVIPFLATAWARALCLALGSTAIWIAYGVTSALLGRSRVDLAIRSLGAIYTASTIAWVGLWLA